MRLPINTRAIARIISCGLVLLTTMLVMPNSAVAETPSDIADEWVDFLSLLPVEEQFVWDTPEYFQIWLTAGTDASGHDTSFWGGLSLEEITDVNYPIDPAEEIYDDGISDEAYEDPYDYIYNDVIYGDSDEAYEDPYDYIYNDVIYGDSDEAYEDPYDYIYNDVIYDDSEEAYEDPYDYIYNDVIYDDSEEAYEDPYDYIYNDVIYDGSDETYEED